MNYGQQCFFIKAESLQVGEKISVLFPNVGYNLKVTAEKIPTKLQGATADYVVIDDLGADR